MHPFFFACQYHPEFNTLPHRPSPPFHGFVLAASGQLDRLPLPPTLLRRKASSGSALHSLSASPLRPLTGGGEVAALTIAEAAVAVSAGGSGRPPVAPSSGAAAATPAAAPAAGSVAGSNIHASPSRPVRTQGDGAVPPVSHVPDIAPGEVSRSGAGGAGGGGADAAFAGSRRDVRPPVDQ